MQTFQLVRVAAEAEQLRWRQRARRLAIRAVLAGIAACFAVAAIAVLHAVGYLALRPHFSGLISAAILLGVDVVLAALFGILAARGGPDAVEREALAVRRTAIAQIGKNFALAATIRMVLRLLRKR